MEVFALPALGDGWCFPGSFPLASEIMLLVQLPVCSLWCIGFAVGVDLILGGAPLVGIARSTHHVSNVAYRAA
jgi:uncharacterized membrane protein HdeD (DUF308 family)